MKELCLGYSKIGGSMNLKVQNKGLYAKPNKKMGYIQLKYFSIYTISTLSKKLLTTVQCQQKMMCQTLTVSVTCLNDQVFVCLFGGG